MRKRLEVPIFQWDCREVSGGDGALDSAVLSRAPTPPSGLNSESVRPPISPDPRRPTRSSRSGVTVDEQRARPSCRLCSASRAGRTGGRAAIARTLPATPLTWDAAAEQRLTRGRCAPHRPVRRSPTRTWAPSSACGTRLPPPLAGRTISSKRLRGTDSIPAFPQRETRGTRDGPGSPTPLPRTPGARAVLVLRHFSAAVRHFGAGTQGSTHLPLSPHPERTVLPARCRPVPAA